MTPGMLEPGNIDLNNRPRVKNADGSISTVRSIGVNIDGREYLLPTVSDDGRIMGNEEAVQNFYRTGKHLGVFKTPQDSTAYAKQLHVDQARQYLNPTPAGGKGQVIDVPGHGQVEFPEGMSDDQIVAAIKRLPAPEQQGTGESALSSIPIAAGKKTDSILDGITQMYLGARGETSALGGLKQNVAEKEALYAPLKAEHPLATSVGEALPSMAAGAGGLVRSLAAGAVPEALSYGSADERLKNAAIGAAGGGVGWGVGRGLGRVLQPAGVAAKGISPEARGAAQRLGYQLSPGQQTQNKALQSLENYFARSPGSSGAAQVAEEANQSALNRAAASSMGQNASDLSEGTFSAAKQGIGSEFERLQQVTAPQLGNDFLNSLVKIDTANAARGAFKSKSIDSLVDKGIDLASQGKLTGTAYKEIRTAISNDADAAFKNGDATLGKALKTVRGALDDAAKSSLSAADQKAWDTTRAQWQAYKTLTNGNVAEGGNVSAARLASAMRGQGDGLRTGAAQGPLSDIARLGEAVKGVPNPTSGQLPQMMMYGNPLTGIPMVAGNKAAGALYRTEAVQRYLKSGLLRIGPNGQILLGTGAKPAGLLGVQQYLGAE